MSGISAGGLSGSAAVYFSPSTPAVSANAGTGTFAVQFIPSNPAVNVGTPTITGITNTVSVQFLPSNPNVLANQGTGGSSAWITQDIGATAVIPNFTAGSASGVSVSGNTIIAPATGESRKIYAYCLTTSTIINNATVNFTNGAGTSPTKFSEHWLQNSFPISLAVTPPGYLFATGAAVTLALLLNYTPTLPVHYSVYYFNESS